MISTLKLKGVFLDYYNNIKRRNIKGQIAVIITLIIAVVFLFTIMFINIAKVSSIKVLTSQTADRAALQIASTIGSMAHYMKENVLHGKESDQCSYNWTAITLIIAGLVLLVLCPPIGASVIGGSIGLGIAIGGGYLLGGLLLAGGIISAYSASRPVVKTIYDELADLSDYNGVREGALLTAIMSMQTDDVLLKNMNGPDNNPTGVFYDDANNDDNWDNTGDPFTDTNGNGLWDPGEPFIDTNGNGLWDAGETYEDLNSNGKYDPQESYEDKDLNGRYSPAELTYDLSNIPEMRKAKVVGRFWAWYQTQRVPLIKEAGLKEAVTDFINKLKQYIVTDQWDSTKWMINRASLAVHRSAEGQPGDRLQVTCSGPSCPTWADAANNRVRIVTIDEDARDTDRNYINDGGFLKDKLVSLCNRLSSRGYSLSLCGISPEFGDTYINAVIDNLVDFTARSKEIMDYPVSERVRTVQTWLKFFYDLEYTHNDATGGQQDLYDRLTYFYHLLDGWAEELRVLHEALVPAIWEDYNTSCEEGRGAAVVACATSLSACYCWHPDCDDCGNCWTVCDGALCINYVTSRWQGDYGTCTGTGRNHLSHPVCMAGGGDLYSARPVWCCGNSGCRTVNCITHSDTCSACSPPAEVTTMQNAYYFQGQLDWTDNGSVSLRNQNSFTEIAQAREIVLALRQDLYELTGIIRALATSANAALKSQEDTIRNGMIYMWGGRDWRYHAVAALLENFPAEFPSVTWKSKNWGFRKCLDLVNARGSATIDTYRYDEDKPMLPWQRMRFRESPVTYIDKATLARMTWDIQSTGLFSGGLIEIAIDAAHLYSASIKSLTTAHYGPDKKDIYLER